MRKLSQNAHLDNIELAGLPLYDAALTLINLAAMTTVADINAISNRSLAIAISEMIGGNTQPECQLAALRARVLENRRNLERSLLNQQRQGVPALRGAESRQCPHCGSALT
jgi:hypothetical protein